MLSLRSSSLLYKLGKCSSRQNRYIVANSANKLKFYSSLCTLSCRTVLCCLSASILCLSSFHLICLHVSSSICSNVVTHQSGMTHNRPCDSPPIASHCILALKFLIRQQHKQTLSRLLLLSMLHRQQPTASDM